MGLELTPESFCFDEGEMEIRSDIWQLKCLTIDYEEQYLSAIKKVPDFLADHESAYVNVEFLHRSGYVLKMRVEECVNYYFPSIIHRSNDAYKSG